VRAVAFRIVGSAGRPNGPAHTLREGRDGHCVPDPRSKPLSATATSCTIRLEGRSIHDTWGIHDRPCGAVKSLTSGASRCDGPHRWLDVVQIALLDLQADLVWAHRQIVRIDPGGGRDLLLSSARGGRQSYAQRCRNPCDTVLPRRLSRSWVGRLAASRSLRPAHARSGNLKFRAC